MYWGEGWEDPATKQLVNRALRVVSNDSSIPMEELTDFFDWLEFEEAGGVGKVKGNEGYEASSLQSWVPRNDSVQHGHFMLYLMDDVISNTSLDRPMEELFFSISLDAGVHPQYAAEGVTNLNCTLRLFLIEGNAVDEDLGKTLPGGAALGKDAKCTWSADDAVEVTFGTSPALLPWSVGANVTAGTGVFLLGTACEDAVAGGVACLQVRNGS